MAQIEPLNIEEKTNVQGPSATGTTGKLTAGEFNKVTERLEALIVAHNKRVFLSEDEYQALVDAGTVDEETEYYVYEE